MNTRIETIGDATLYLGDCMDILPTLDKVDAVITDPPYGIGFGSFNRTNRTASGKTIKANQYHTGDWDKSFSIAPFLPEFERLSATWFIWGGNYFPELWAKPSKAIVFWNKHQPCKNFSQGELAWTNIDMPARHIDFAYYGGIEGNTKALEKNHPTQKPLQVMVQCIELCKNFPQTILDPFMGSGTTGVASIQMGRKFIGIEREPKYFDIACQRIEQAVAQPRLFEDVRPKQEQTSLI